MGPIGSLACTPQYLGRDTGNQNQWQLGSWCCETVSQLRCPSWCQNDRLGMGAPTSYWVSDLQLILTAKSQPDSSKGRYLLIRVLCAAKCEIRKPWQVSRLVNEDDPDAQRKVGLTVWQSDIPVFFWKLSWYHCFVSFGTFLPVAGFKHD